MRRLILVMLIGVAVAACPEPDARAGEPPIEPVDMDTLAWAVEGRSIEYGDARWVMVGPPVYEPLALTRVGEFEGTPLYGERGVASPARRIYIPVGGGYWQMLERGQPIEQGEVPPDDDLPPGPDPELDPEA